MANSHSSKWASSSNSALSQGSSSDVAWSKVPGRDSTSGAVADYTPADFVVIVKRSQRVSVTYDAGRMEQRRNNIILNRGQKKVSSSQD